MITAVITCINCQRPQEVEMTEDQLHRLKNCRSTGEHVQDILPHHSADERELFISGICPICWKDLFGDKE